MPSAAVPRSEPRLQRARGRLRLAVGAHLGRTRLARLYQEGSAKARLPRAFRDDLEAVLINTAGGLTGGDDMAAEVTVADGAALTLTSQACEKIYRAVDGVARVTTRVALGAGARLDWLPQETILFDGAGLSRAFEAEMAADARLLAVESFVFGRAARGEVVARGSLRDRWRVRRAGRLVFADELRLEGGIAEALARPAVAAGGRALATLLLVAPDAQACLGAARAALGKHGGVAGGASAFDGRLVARMVAPDGQDLRRALVALLAALRGGAALPRVWTI